MSQVLVVPVNLLERAVVTCDPPEDPLFLLADLYGGDPQFPFRFGSLTASPKVEADIDELKGEGDFEGAWTGGAASPPPGFTIETSGTGSPTVAPSTTSPPSGAKWAELSIGVGTGRASLKTQRKALSGQRYQLRMRLKGAGPSRPPIRANVQNLDTLKQLTPSGTPEWSTAGQEVFSQTDTTTSLVTRAFRVESLEDCGYKREVTFLIHVFFDGDGGVAMALNVDDIELIPACNGFSIHGHNADPLNRDFEAVGADDAAFALSVTPADGIFPGQPSFYASFAETFRRHWRIFPNGTTNTAASGALWYGQLVLWQAIVLQRNPDYPIREEFVSPQVRHLNFMRGQSVFSWGDHPLRNYVLPFSHRNLAQYEEMRDEIYRRSGGGAEPIVFVPDTVADVVTFARVQATVGFSRSGLFRRDSEISIEEMPVPRVVA